MVEDLSPLSALQSLEKLEYRDMPWCDKPFPMARHPPSINPSLLPLARCAKLKELWCSYGAKDLEVLAEKRPDILMGLTLDTAYSARGVSLFGLNYYVDNLKKV